MDIEDANAPVPTASVPAPASVPATQRKTEKARHTVSHDPNAIRRAFESGDYPYSTKIGDRDYLERAWGCCRPNW